MLIGKMQTSPKSYFCVFYGVIGIFKDYFVSGYAVQKLLFFEILHLYMILKDMANFWRWNPYIAQIDFYGFYGGLWFKFI